ncbi:MAG TPA: hypothetical protein VNB52_07470 [Ilumatobacteraceae bacterium]|nr:hypothetical protein [Ilumatobacteraceae bacterium]
MSAREDYPNPWGHWKEALDEIDQLREDRDLWLRAEKTILQLLEVVAELRAEIVDLQEMVRALNAVAESDHE